MNCHTCHSPLLYCNCMDSAEQIEAFLKSDAGKKMATPLYNQLVRRASLIFDRRIGAPPPRPPRGTRRRA
jgi:hypothetical protein